MANETGTQPTSLFVLRVNVGGVGYLGNNLFIIVDFPAFAQPAINTNFDDFKAVLLSRQVLQRL